VSLFGEVLQEIATRERPSFGEALAAHLELSVLALLTGILVAIPLAVAVSRTRLGALVAINITNLGRAVPDLAVLGFGFVLFGLGFVPAYVALALISIPPIMINAVTGLNQVDAKVVDSARGMGFSGFQILTRVRLPLAAPVIFAGIRTAAVQVIAGATLATFIGGGGLGDLIVAGFQSNSVVTQLAGAIPVALLAIVAELLFGGLERLSTPKGLRLTRKAGA
jgi:osmoprotectant transport system permease protein